MQVPINKQEKGLTDSGIYASFDTDSRSSKGVVGETVQIKFM